MAKTGPLGRIDELETNLFAGFLVLGAYPDPRPTGYLLDGVETNPPLVPFALPPLPPVECPSR